MTKKQKRHIIATVGTVLFMLLVFLVLWFARMIAILPEQEEGIEVAFGNVEDAGGYMPEQSETLPMPTPETTVPEQPSAPSDNELITQEDPEAIALRKAREEAERKCQQAEAEERRRQREEQARLEEERRAREAAEAEAQRKAQELIAGKFNGAGAGTNGDGSGDGQGSGHKGNPAGKGHGSDGGNSWSLAGRDLKAMPKPSNQFNQEGTVVLEIRVNSEGRVVNVVDKLEGTVSDKATRKLAIEAAYKAMFSELVGANEQIGKVTYIFRLN